MAVVEAEVVGGVGHIVLNRPEALNSLNEAMIHGIRAALDAWRDDDTVGSVLVTSRSPRAFCAGGDIKAIRQAVIDGDRTFDLQWRETRFVNGQQAGAERWRALITVAHQPPRNEAELMRNPLGLKIEDVSWTPDAS